MGGSANIHDVRIRELEPEPTAFGSRLIALRFDDHLLRRFGSLEIVKLAPGSKTDPFVRDEADEIWVLVEGSVSCTFRDIREGSPTSNAVLARTVAQASQIFVPFGIAFALKAGDSGAVLLRITTHEPGPDVPATGLTWEELLED